jgi:hypothetical protein
MEGEVKVEVRSGHAFSWMCQKRRPVPEPLYSRKPLHREADNNICSSPNIFSLLFSARWNIALFSQVFPNILNYIYKIYNIKRI